jgi:hypothetical protein
VAGAPRVEVADEDVVGRVVDDGGGLAAARAALWRSQQSGQRQSSTTPRCGWTMRASRHPCFALINV